MVWVRQLGPDFSTGNEGTIVDAMERVLDGTFFRCLRKWAPEDV